MKIASLYIIGPWPLENYVHINISVLWSKIRKVDYRYYNHKRIIFMLLATEWSYCKRFDFFCLILYNSGHMSLPQLHSLFFYYFHKILFKFLKQPRSSSVTSCRSNQKSKVMFWLWTNNIRTDNNSTLTRADKTISLGL